jgi:hypothetical protein
MFLGERRIEVTKKANITVIGFPKILTSCQEVAEEYLNNANFLYYQYMPEVQGVKYISSSPDHPLEKRAKSFAQVNQLQLGRTTLWRKLKEHNIS